VPGLYPRSGGLRQTIHGADNLATFTYVMSSKSGILNFLEPSGPVQACMGIGLPLKMSVIWKQSNKYERRSFKLF
jgi:hypothetical protein